MKILIGHISPFAQELLRFNQQMDNINFQAQKLSESTGISFYECKQVILDGMRIVVEKCCSVGPSFSHDNVLKDVVSETISYNTNTTPKEYGQSLKRNRRKAR
jgi:hypothetical protein